ncbi:hypothetical protein DS885_03960 [Psychromonas sp. B3M02]|nr:hypothetical protein DS885_03960 [Psychromonas sp. B3M02]
MFKSLFQFFFRNKYKLLGTGFLIIITIFLFFNALETNDLAIVNYAKENKVFFSVIRLIEYFLFFIFLYFLSKKKNIRWVIKLAIAFILFYEIFLVLRFPFMLWSD